MGALHHIIVISDISLKTRCFGLYRCRRKFGYIFNHSYPFWVFVYLGLQ